jgi:hypothetical protein
LLKKINSFNNLVEIYVKRDTENHNKHRATASSFNSLDILSRKFDEMIHGNILTWVFIHMVYAIKDIYFLNISLFILAVISYMVLDRKGTSEN